MARLDPREQKLQGAIDKLSEDNRRELATAIGKRNCDAVWFDEPEVVEKARSWVQKKIDEAPGLDIPSGLLQLQRALRS